MTTEGESEPEMQVAQVTTSGGGGSMDISQLLEALLGETRLSDFGEEQRKDQNLLRVIQYLEDGLQLSSDCYSWTPQSRGYHQPEQTEVLEPLPS